MPPASSTANAPSANVEALNAAREASVQAGQSAYQGNQSSIGAFTGQSPAAPATPATVIHADQATPTATPNYPDTTTPSAAQANAQASLAAATAASTAQNSPATPTSTQSATTPSNGTTGTSTSNTDATPSSGLSAIASRILGLDTQDADKSSYTQAENQDYDVDAKTKALNDVTNEYNSRQQYYNDQVAALQKGGGDATQINERISQVTNQKNAELADIAVRQAAANGDLTTATDLAQKAVDAKYQPIEDEIKNLTSYYGLVQNDMTDSEKTAAQAAIQQKSDDAALGRSEALADYNEKIQKADPLYQAQVAKEQADAAASEASLSGSGNMTTVTDQSGNAINVPTSIAPYYNTSPSGVGYVDASTLQGTDSDKTKIINDAQAAGVKVVTNKNEAADLTNIQNAYANLDTMSSIFDTTTSANPVSRALNNIGLNQASVALQTNAQKASAGALNDSALDILKAISGIQGFRGNASAIAQIKESLPTIYDTTEVANTKLANVRTLIQNREDAILGNSSSDTGTTGNNPLGI